MNNRFKPFLLLALAPLLWSGNLLIGKLSHNTIPPFAFAFYRWLLVIILLIPFCMKDLFQHRKAIKTHWWRIIVLGFFSITTYTSFVYLGLHYTSVINTSLFKAVVPVLIVVLSCFLIGERLSINKVIGVTLSFVGVLLIITRGHLSTLLHLHFNVGDVLILVSSVGWAIFSVLFKKFDLKFPLLLFLLLTAVVGEITLLPCIFVERHMGYHMQWSWINFGYVFYTALFSSVIAYSSWNLGVSKVGPSIAALFFNLFPVFSALLAILFLHEKIYPYHMIGFVLVFVGIYLVARYRSHKLTISRAIAAQ